MEEPAAKRSRSADTDDGDDDDDNFRYIKLDMRKYGEEVRRLLPEDLVRIFEIGLKVRESLSVVVNQNVLEQALTSQMAPVKDIVANIEREVKQSDQRLVDHIQHINTDIKPTLNKCKDQLVEMSSSLKRSNVKGSIGEIQVMKVLKDHFGNFTITDVSKTQRGKQGKGDIQVETQRQQKIMIEVKNRKSNVPQDEIDRFKSDLKSSPDFRVGILFSMASGIANKASNGKFQVKFNKNQYQIYVPNAGKDEALIIWSVLMADELTLALHEELRSSQVDKLGELYEEFQETIKREKMCRSNLDSLEDAAKSLRKNMDFILKNVDKTRKELKKLLNSDVADQSRVATIISESVA